jgi:hypothetical protein
MEIPFDAVMAARDRTQVPVCRTAVLITQGFQCRKTLHNGNIGDMPA